MATVRVNLLANYLGRICSGAITVLLVPTYIKFMGIEAYGLVGLYVSLLGIFAICDLGLSAVVTRELAGAEGISNQVQYANDLVHTLQFVYWAIACIIAVVFALSSSWLAEYWLNTVALSPSDVRHALFFMGITIAGQMLFGFYMAGLLGLQRHVTVNVLIVCFVGFRSLGALLVLWLIESSVTVFFAWQALSGLLGVAVASKVMGRSLPKGTPVLRPQLLRKLWIFAAGTTAASLSFVLVHQTDKILLSRMMSLEEFGYYAFAGVAVGVMQYLSSPIFATFYPSFARKAALGQEAELVLQYHRASQVMAVVIVPAGAILVCFAGPLLRLWTADSDLAARVLPFTVLLGLGMTLHTLTTLPYSLQLAHGWTSLTVSSNVVLFVVLILSIFLVVPRHGAAGAALVWAILNGVHLLISVWFMHRRV